MSTKGTRTRDSRISKKVIAEQRKISYLLRRNDLVREINAISLLNGFGGLRPGWRLTIDDKDFIKKSSSLFEAAQGSLWQLSRSQQKKIKSFIDYLIQKMHLSPEWQDTFLILITKGVLCPPKFNLSVGATGTERYFCRVVLTLNPDTSLADIEDIWQYVRAEQKRLWPGYEAKSFTKGHFLALISSADKSIISEDEKYALLNGYERKLLKGNDPELAKKEILRYRQNMRIEEKRREPIDRNIRIKKKKTDSDIARQKGLKGKKLKREVNRVRAARSRLKKMTFS